MHGLYYTYQRLVVALPLLSVHADVSIKELAAQVNLTQTYRNDATFPIEAKYSFPVPARAAVSSFVMVKQDGTRVVGSVLEKLEARKTYDAAVSRGQQASLMEQQTPDVFNVAVGNIPPNEQVQIELVYATELSEDEENDSVRFHLPAYIGDRYGHAPSELTSAPPSSAFLTINASVEALAPISKIGSPSHTVSIELGPDPELPNFKELPSSNYARISLSSDAALDKDFVLTIKSAGLDSPRCVAELHPTHNTSALALTFVPRFTLPDLPRQEFILLVDRSGSMHGDRIAAARKALVVLLRVLPHQDTLFQLTSFGSRVSPLWNGGSRVYNQETLEEATRHVDSMDADHGGTEIREALKHTFANRARDRPTSVLLLTDGEAWDLDGVLDTVNKAVEAAPDGAPLRVSVLGIGNGVSTAMCEGIARVGHGTAMFVTEQETSFAGKIARLLKAARTPLISNITVDWGSVAAVEAVEITEPEADSKILEEVGGAKNQTLNVFDVDVDPTLLDETLVPPAPPVILPPPAAVQQSPFKIKNLFPGSRVNIYAILQGKVVPSTVTLRGWSPDGAEIALSVPVTVSRLPSSPALHALAARKIIQDLEDGQHAIPSTDADLLERTVRAHIVRLGTTYQITSTHTSFVAIDETQKQGRLRYAPEDSPPEPEDLMLADQDDLFVHDELDGGSAKAWSPRYAVPPLSADRSSVFGKVSGFFRSRPQFMMHRASSSFGSSTVAYDAQAPLANAPHAYSAPASSHPPASPSSVDALEALARLQAFDGAFSSLSAVLGFVPLKAGTTPADFKRALALPAETPEELEGTVVALAFLAAKMRSGDLSADGAERDAWAGMYEKARDWVEAALRDLGVNETIEEMEAKVAAMIEI